MKHTQERIKVIRAEQLKNKIIPKDMEEIRRLQALTKRAYTRWRKHRNQLHNIMADLRVYNIEEKMQEPIDNQTELGKPKGIKIPKSIGGKGK